MTRTRGAAPRARMGQRMSLRRWADLPEDDDGELVGGVLVEEEADFSHEGIVASLMVTTRAWVHPRGGFVGGSNAKFALGPGHGRKPDLSVFLPGRGVPPRDGAATVPADIMVEVISRTPRDVHRDRVEKPAAYATFGVRFYWLIDPNARTFEMFELDETKRYIRVLDASQGIVDAPGCPGLRVDVDELWAEIDRLGPPASVATPPERKAKRARPRGNPSVPPATSGSKSVTRSPRRS